MATQASSVIYPNAGYTETSKKLRAFLSQARFRLKENVFAISGTISYLEQYPRPFDFYEYLGGRGMRLSIRAGMSKNQAEAKRLRRLAGECLVESAFLSEDKPRSEIALRMKNALSKTIAIFEEETPKIKDAESLILHEKDQDALGTLLYVYTYFGMASKEFSKAGLGGFRSFLREYTQNLPR